MQEHGSSPGGIDSAFDTAALIIGLSPRYAAFFGVFSACPFRRLSMRAKSLLRARSLASAYFVFFGMDNSFRQALLRQRPRHVVLDQELCAAVIADRAAYQDRVHWRLHYSLLPAVRTSEKAGLGSRWSLRRP